MSLWIQKTSLKNKVCEILPSQDLETFPKIAKRKTRQRRWEWLSPGGEGLPTNRSGFGKGGTTWGFYFSLRRADSGKNSHPSLAPASIPYAGSGIYQNLARFSINFNFSFPLLFKGITSQFTRKSLSVPLTLRKAHTGAFLCGRHGGVLKAISLVDFSLRSCSFYRSEDLSERRLTESALNGEKAEQWESLVRGASFVFNSSLACFVLFCFELSLFLFIFL